MVGMNSIKKILKWILGLLIINLIGLILITLYSAYYSFGTMIFGVHTESAIKKKKKKKKKKEIPNVIGINLHTINTTRVRI